MIPTMALLQREIVRFYRQRSRIIGSLATPLVFWLLLGSGFGSSFQTAGKPGAGYLEYFFPGVLTMILLFTAIFSTISIIEDRKEGFLQAVLVAPVKRSSIVLGKVLGSTVLALFQATLFLFLLPFAGLSLGVAQFSLIILSFALVGFGLSALGFLIAWRMESIQGFHSIMNLVLLPMWLLSGAVFPVSGASSWMAWLMRLNPLTYGMDLIRYSLSAGGLPSPILSFTAVVGFSLVLFAACLWSVQKTKVRA